eukprot:2540739-Karenia_brevis.AAC.1
MPLSSPSLDPWISVGGASAGGCFHPAGVGRAFSGGGGFGPSSFGGGDDFGPSPFGSGFL